MTGKYTLNNHEVDVFNRTLRKGGVGGGAPSRDRYSTVLADDAADDAPIPGPVSSLHTDRTMVLFSVNCYFPLHYTFQSIFYHPAAGTAE